MRSIGVAAACIAILVVAGCVQPRERTVEDAPDWTPNLDEAPVWVRGEWWEATAHTEFHAEGQTSGRVVVADRSSTHAFVGMPAEQWNDLLLLGHFPFVGEVRQSDMAFLVHDDLTQWLRFPLDEGATWDTSFVGTPVTAVVHRESDTVATVEILGGLFDIFLTYDATMRTITRFDIAGYGLIEVTDHGYGHVGDVIVPVDQTLPIFHGRAILVADVDPDPLVPAPGLGLDPVPANQVTVEPRDAASGIVFAGNFALVPAESPGLYVEVAIAPGGQRWQVVRTPADGVGLSSEVFHVQSPGGTWSMVHMAGGAGLVATELLTYNEQAYLLTA
jgi:hypothetical protein